MSFGSDGGYSPFLDRRVPRYNRHRQTDGRTNRSTATEAPPCSARLSASRDYLARVGEALEALDPAQVEALSDLIEERWRSGRFVFIAGNGGSGANASHLCEDLAKCTLRDFEGQKRLKVLSLTDNTPWITAVANDIGYHDVFAEQLRNLGLAGRPADRHLGLGQQPEHPQGRRVGQRPRPDDRRRDRVRRRQA